MRRELAPLAGASLVIGGVLLFFFKAGWAHTVGAVFLFVFLASGFFVLAALVVESRD